MGESTVRYLLRMAGVTLVVVAVLAGALALGVVAALLLADVLRP